MKIHLIMLLFACSLVMNVYAQGHTTEFIVVGKTAPDSFQRTMQHNIRLVFDGINNAYLKKQEKLNITKASATYEASGESQLRI